jgi:hypothetical protein
MSTAITNNSISDIKSTIKSYYDTLFIESDKTYNLNGIKKNYFFNIMGNITNFDITLQYDFNILTSYCIDYKLGTKKSDFDDRLQILDINNTNGARTINPGIIDNIHKNIRTVNVIIDILNAYKHFIDNNIGYINNIDSITQITLSNNATISSLYSSPNLTLSIPSYNDLTTTSPVYTSKLELFNSNGIYEKGTAFTELSQLSTHKNIISNLMFFLLNINKENANVIINTLYYYYELVKCYMLLVCASTNIAINNIKDSRTSDLFHRIRLTKGNNNGVIYKSYDIEYLTPYTSGSPFQISKNNLINEFSTINNYVYRRLEILKSNLILNNSSFNKLKNKEFNFYVSSDSTNATKIYLNYNNNNTDNKTLIDNTLKKIKYINNGKYYLYHSISDKYYKITDYNIDKKYIIIEAIYYTTLRNDSNKDIETLEEDIIFTEYVDPKSTSSAINSELANNGILLSGCKFELKNFVTLKKEYYTKKEDLYNTNNDIKSNLLKLNNLKNSYIYNKDLDDNLNTQLTSLYIILGIICIVFIGVLMSKLNNNIKKTITILFVCIILLLLIIFYIINNKSNIEENFSVNSVTDIANATDIDKMDYINNNLKKFVIESKLYLNLIKTHIKNIDSSDLYHDLTNIMDKESNDKKKIVDTLYHKKIVGKTDIDVFKYGYYNKKIYIGTLLAIALFIMSFYLIYIMNPDIDKKVLLFIGTIIFIIILSYYIININAKVRSNSPHYYWGSVSLY